MERTGKAGWWLFIARPLAGESVCVWGGDARGLRTTRLNNVEMGCNE